MIKGFFKKTSAFHGPVKTALTFNSEFPDFNKIALA